MGDDRFKRLREAGLSFLSELGALEKEMGEFSWDRIVQLAHTYANDLIEEGIKPRDTQEYLLGLLDRQMMEVFNDRDRDSNGVATGTDGKAKFGSNEETG